MVFQERKGVGMKLLVALMLALGIAVVILSLLIGGQTDAQGALGDAESESQRAAQDSTSSLGEKANNIIKENMNPGEDINIDLGGGGGGSGGTTTNTGGDTDGTSTGDSDGTSGGGGTGEDGADSGGAAASSPDGALVIHFTPTSQVSNFQQRVSAYQNGITQHTPFGDQCPVYFQTDQTGNLADADIVFTVSHENPADRTAELVSTWISSEDPSVGTLVENSDQATGTLYAGIIVDGTQYPYNDAAHGTAAAHETLHEFAMCEEYSEQAWEQGDDQIYSAAGGCVNPWNRQMYDAENRQSACQTPPVDSATGAACGSVTGDGYYSIMGKLNAQIRDGKIGHGDPSQRGLPQEDISPLKQLIEQHAGITCQ